MNRSWKKVDDNIYVFTNGPLVFTLQVSDEGVLSMGQAWILWARKKKEITKAPIASFWTIDDNRHTYRLRSVDSKLWDNIEEIKSRAVLLLKELHYTE